MMKGTVASSLSPLAARHLSKNPSYMREADLAYAVVRLKEARPWRLDRVLAVITRADTLGSGGRAAS